MKRFDSIEIELFLFSQFLILISSTSLAIFRQRKFKDPQKEERLVRLSNTLPGGVKVL